MIIAPVVLYSWGSIIIRIMKQSEIWAVFLFIYYRVKGINYESKRSITYKRRRH